MISLVRVGKEWAGQVFLHPDNLASSQSYDDCLGVREYITMDIYWIISLYFREILFCEYEIFENDLKF